MDGDAEKRTICCKRCPLHLLVLASEAPPHTRRVRESLFGCERFWQILKGPLAHRRPIDRGPRVGFVSGLQLACLSTRARPKGAPMIPATAWVKPRGFPMSGGPELGEYRRHGVSGRCDGRSFWASLLPPLARPSLPEGTVRNLGTKFAETDAKTQRSRGTLSGVERHK